MDCSLPGSSVHGIFQARVLEWVATASSAVIAAREHNSCGAQAELPFGMWALFPSEIESVSPALAGGFFTPEPPGTPPQMSPHYVVHLYNSALAFLFLYYLNKLALVSIIMSMLMIFGTTWYLSSIEYLFMCQAFEILSLI